MRGALGRSREPLCQGGHGRGLEDVHDGEFDAQDRADPVGQAYREQRVAADAEEVVVHADRAAVEDLGEQLAQDLLARGTRPVRARGKPGVSGEPGLPETSVAAGFAGRSRTRSSSAAGRSMSATGAAGSSATARRMRSRPAARARAVAGSNWSAANSRAPLMPCGVRSGPSCSATARVRSYLAVPVSRGGRRRARAARCQVRPYCAAPGFAAPVLPAAVRRTGFCRTSITWNSGWRAAERAGFELLHQPLERHVLVGVGGQADLPHPRQQLGESRVAGQCRCAAPGC